jgi:hypothetical protein
MTERAQKIWKAFCGELIDNGVKDSEDVRQGLSTTIKEVANELQYYNTSEGEDMIIDARDLYDLATEIENL